MRKLCFEFCRCREETNDTSSRKVSPKADNCVAAFFLPSFVRTEKRRSGLNENRTGNEIRVALAKRNRFLLKLRLFARGLIVATRIEIALSAARYTVGPRVCLVAVEIFSESLYRRLFIACREERSLSDPRKIQFRECPWVQVPTSGTAMIPERRIGEGDSTNRCRRCDNWKGSGIARSIRVSII